MAPPNKPGPLLGYTVPTYPTPIISNTIEAERVMVETGKYTPVPFGTRYNDIKHGSFPKDLPDHVLVYDSPEDPDGRYRKRIWVNNRIDQDLYNFQVDYEGNNPAFPIYTRVYVLPRDAYTPLLALTDDPVDPHAKLISEQLVNQTEPQELSTQYVKVARVYQTLPGIITNNIDYPYGGLTGFPRITSKQKVEANSATPGMPGESCPVPGYEGARLISQSVARTENGNIDELTRIYEITPALLDQIGFGYAIQYENNDINFPMITWAFVINKALYTTAASLSACPIEDFESLKLVSQKLTGDPAQNQVVSVERKYETLPGPFTYQIDYDNNDVAYPMVKTSRRVARTAYVPGTEGTDLCSLAGYETLKLAEQHAKTTDSIDVIEDQRIFEITPSNIITTRDYDTDLNADVITTRQKIISNQALIRSDLTLDVQEQPIDKWRTLQVISYLNELPPTKVEFQTGSYPFPTLLTGINLYVVELTSATDKEVIWYPNTLRPLQNVPAVFRITTEFFTAQPPAVNIFIMPTRDLVFRGRSFQIAINGVLCDSIALSASFSGDNTYGDLTEGITFSATNPSATDYYNAIGTYQVTGCDIARYRGNIWIKQTTEVILA